MNDTNASLNVCNSSQCTKFLDLPLIIGIRRVHDMRNSKPWPKSCRHIHSKSFMKQISMSQWSRVLCVLLHFGNLGSGQCTLDVRMKGLVAQEEFSPFTPSTAIASKIYPLGLI